MAGGAPAAQPENSGCRVRPTLVGSGGARQKWGGKGCAGWGASRQALPHQAARARDPVPARVWGHGAALVQVVLPQRLAEPRGGEGEVGRGLRGGGRWRAGAWAGWQGGAAERQERVPPPVPPVRRPLGPSNRTPKNKQGRCCQPAAACAAAAAARAAAARASCSRSAFVGSLMSRSSTPSGRHSSVTWRCGLCARGAGGGGGVRGGTWRLAPTPVPAPLPLGSGVLCQARAKTVPPPQRVGAHLRLLLDLLAVEERFEGGQCLLLAPVPSGAGTRGPGGALSTPAGHALGAGCTGRCMGGWGGQPLTASWGPGLCQRPPKTAAP